MRQRLISAAVFIAFGVVVLFFYQTMVLNLVIALIIFASAYELLMATHLAPDRLLFAFCAAFGVSLPFLQLHSLHRLAWVACYLFIVALFCYVITHHGRVRLERIGLSFFLTMLVSCAFTCFVLLRDQFSKSASETGLFYIVLALVGAWMSDAGGYFIGRALGRHKLAPSISPKKTVEGAVGGWIFSMLGVFGLSFAFAAISAAQLHPVSVRVLPLLILSLLLPAVSILGDLSMSVLKRETHLKDFGNVIPGHGGVMDRFDSVMLAAPLVYLYVQMFPIVVG